MSTWDRRFYLIQIIKIGVPCGANNSQALGFILGQGQSSHLSVDGSVRSILTHFIILGSFLCWSHCIRSLTKDFTQDLACESVQGEQFSLGQGWK